MRRVVGLVLAGLGTCLIVFAVLMPTFVSGKVLKFPLNNYETATLAASNVSYFSPTKLTELTGVNMEATYTIKGNASAGSSSTAVWNEFTYVYDQTNKLPFQTTTRTFAFDRRTARLVQCCGANINGNSSIRQSGYVGYVLPIGTKKQTYDIFDITLNKPMPLTYAGTGTVDGIKTYRFTENVPATKIGSQTLPGSLVGMSQATVTLPQYYQLHLTYWIDPDTGALLNVNEHEKLTLEDGIGAQALLLLDANFAATPASVSRIVALDKTGRNKLSLISTTLPLVTGIAGVVLLVAGILLARKPREDVEAGPATAPELAAQDADSPDRAVAQASLVPGLDDEPAEAESPAAQNEAAEAETEAAEAPEAEAVEAPAAEAEAPAAEAEAEAPEAEAAEAPAAEAPAAEAPAAEAPAAEAPAAEAPEAETPEAEAPAAPAEAPAAEMPAANGDSPAAADAPAAAEANGQAQEAAPAATPQRGRRTARHRR